ncbi:type IV pilus assembly protein PilN [Desulfosarcina sp. BuS5]|uniref:PilN domain-containing protein n=1 Tax=Desulfosarcina sp. BuS5 TaxID=933262 RepID=UPI0004814549|nr:PilN domain-containing protein [Desulfosarcina sp. BuS5]WDN88110.1 type IV pilus assembly protein PilN [Desulfosarcina sp. BuS5]
MIRINLLPFRAARKKENIRRQVSVFLLMLIMVVIVTVTTNICMGKKVQALSNEVAAKKIELAKYDKINKEIESIKKKLKNLDKKMDVIKVLESNRKGPLRLLDSMTGIVVENRMWLTNMDEQKGAVNIKGIAIDEETVANFMRRLESSGLFASVNLKTMKQTSVGKQKMSLKSFVLNCPKKAATQAKKKAGNKANK